MADLFTDVATKENAPAQNEMLSAQRGDFKAHGVNAVIELAGAPADTVIAVCRLHKGDEVQMDSYVMFDDLGTGVTMDIGDDDPKDSGGAGDIDRYADGIDVAAAAGVFAFNSVPACIDKAPYTVQADCWLTAKILGAAGTGTVKFFVKIARAGG